MMRVFVVEKFGEDGAIEVWCNVVMMYVYLDDMS